MTLTGGESNSASTHGEELQYRVIGGDQGPVPVDGDSRVRGVSLDNELDGLASGGERRVVELSFTKDRSVA